MIRIQSVHLIGRIHSEVPRDFINRRVSEVLLNLAEDPVHNIRFNVSKTMALLQPALSEGNKDKMITALQKMADSD